MRNFTFQGEKAPYYSFTIFQLHYILHYFEFFFFTFENTSTLLVLQKYYTTSFKYTLQISKKKILHYSSKIYIYIHYTIFNLHYILNYTLHNYFINIKKTMYFE